jgi:hypothetical protein
MNKQPQPILLFAAILLLAILPSLQGAEPAPPYPLWDGHERLQQ